MTPVPEPDACAACGHPRYRHHQRWAMGAGLHTYEPPTDAVRLARMRARRADRTALRKPPFVAE